MFSPLSFCATNPKYLNFFTSLTISSFNFIPCPFLFPLFSLCFKNNIYIYIAYKYCISLDMFNYMCDIIRNGFAEARESYRTLLSIYILTKIFRTFTNISLQKYNRFFCLVNQFSRFRCHVRLFFL